MSKKQKTLFETWNKNPSSPTHNRSDRNSSISNKNGSTPHHFRVFDASSSNISSNSPFQTPKNTKKDELVNPEFDYEAGKTWIYPTNYPLRDYQFSIVQEALFKNTLVVLPTGLGKTFIAAVVMYNIYRWFPNGKVIFMAPTKPLVAQQVDACFNITGIPLEDTTQMTGTNSPEIRKTMWMRKRVFFLTPQVLVNDLVRNICSPSTIRCLVVDEAHKALGNHAYCQVIKELLPCASQFRILALTATPGSETQSVKHILANLLISHVEIRSEDSADVQQYTHVRDVEKIVVPLGERLTGLKFKFLDVINTYLKRLTMRNAMTSKNPSSLSKFQVLKLREAFSQNPPGNIDRATFGLAMADFSLLISLYHAYELLLLHGATTFYNFLAGILKGDKSIPHARTELLKNNMFEEIMTNVKENYIPETSTENTSHPNGQIQKRKVLPGHPKLDKLLEVILGHFKKAEEENITDTRVMIFTQYRDSVQEIVNMLNQYEPTVKVMSFIGQASKSATNMGYSQKQQLKVIQQFRSGGYNTLVSTCVGEEGLDIGEVDLIVCYDCPKSPIRSVQRMGRTGRLRKGRIVMLIAEGKEEQMYNTCEYRKKNIHQAIRRGFSFTQLYQNSASLIPPGVKPICVKTAITVPKKQEPKTKVISKSPFLNDEEMMEFNQYVKVPPCEGPLLSKREFIVLKNKEVIQEESFAEMKPRLSLSEWTLWQTTPQRTDMIPHSSKSLLLVKTLEYIHFPELLSSTKALNVPDLTDFQQKSSTDFSKRDFNSLFSNQTKKPNATSIAHTVDNEDVVTLMSSPERELFEIDNHVKPSISPTNVPLIEQLFNVKMSIDYKKCAMHSLKSPPNIIRTFDIEEFSRLDLKEIGNSENKGVSILRVLNKKLKAKRKRKSRVLGRSMSSKDIQSSISTTIVESPSKSINMNEKHQPLVEVCTEFNSEGKRNNEYDSDGVLFDIDFDIPEMIENELQVYDNRITASNKTTDVQNKLIMPDNESKSHSLNLNVDDRYIDEKLNPKDIEEIDISYSPSSNKDFVDLETQEIAGNVEKSKATNLVCQLEYSKDNPNQKSDSNALPHDFNKNKEQMEDEKIFDSINFDLEFGQFSDELINNEECNILRKSVKANEYSKQSFLEADRKNIKEADLNISTFSKSNNSMNSKDDYFNVPSSINKEKQSIVLNDIKNTSSVVVQKSTNDDSFNEKSCTSASTKNYSEHVVNCINKNSVKTAKDNSFLPNNECKNVTMNNPSGLNTKTPSSCIKNDGMDVLKSVKPEAIKYVENKKDYNGSFSSDNCKKSKLSLKVKSISKTSDETSKDGDQCSKQTKSNQYNSDSDIKHAKNSFLKNSENNSVECNFDFDVSFGNNDVEANQNSTSHGPALSEPTKLYSFSKNLNPVDDMDEFDKDANSILEQLFTSQKNVPTDLNSSFSSPLTIKRCISEVDESPVSESPKKAQRTSSYLHVRLSNSFTKVNKQNESDGFKTPYRKNNLSLNKTNSPRGNATANISADTSQYPLTQLLSLIDDTENSKICFETPPNKLSLKKASEPVVDASSDDEVCPTPQKEISKLKSEFIYSKKSGASRSLDFKDCDKHPKELLGFQKFAGNEQRRNMLSLKNSSKIKQNATVCGTVEYPPVEKEEIDCEVSPKISFDISFDLPFTEDKLEDSLKEEMLDLNNALIIESSSSEEKLSQNDCSNIFKYCDEEKNKLLTKDSTPEVINKNNIVCIDDSNKSDLFLSEEDMEAEDSESLLPQIEISTKGLLNQPVVSHSKMLNSKSINNEIIEGQIIENNSNSCKNQFENKLKNNTSPKLSSGNNSISFDMPFCNSSTVDTNKNKTDGKYKTNSSTSLSRTNVLNANVSENHISNGSCVQTKLKEKENELQKNNLHLETTSLEKIFENLSEDRIILDEKEIGKNDEQCVDLSEEKLCFDLNFDDQYTCDLLPTKISPKRHLDLQKQSSHQNVTERCNFFMDSPKKEELKTISKKSIFKKPDACNVEAFGKLNEANDELVWEFDLNDDQSFMLELKDNHPHAQNQTTFHVVDNNSSDEFDLYNPNQSKKSNQCNKLSSKLATVRECKSSDAGSSGKKPPTSADSKKDQANIKKKKLSSKLSTKNQTNKKIDLKNNTTVEDEEDDDFQFIRRVEKKVSKPSTSNNRKRKKLSSRNDFLCTQAEASGSDNSGHESMSDGDVFEGSFIDDESPNKYNDTDQHAFYLKSIKNCAGLPKKFKLKEMANDNFLQEPNEDYSNYELDSFCVNDEEVLYLSSDEEPKVRSKLKPKNKSKEYEKSKNKKKAFRRVISHDSSSEYETSPQVSRCVTNNSIVSNVPVNPHDDSIIAVKKAKHKLVIVSSDEENEYQFVKPLKHVHKKTENVPQHSSNIQSAISKPAIDNHKIDFEDSIQFIPTVSTKGNQVSSTSKKSPDATTARYKPSACFISSNVPSTSKAMQDESDLSHIQDISFDVGWNEIGPSVSIHNEESPPVVKKKNETFSSNFIDVDKSDSVSVILVDSRELASGKPVISALRNRHKINPVVISQTYADYVISNRIAVERVFDSEFNNIPMPPKIIEKVKQIIGLYEKLVIIVERDNRKNIMSFNKNVTKYLQFVVHANLHSSIEVMFSKSTDHTSELIANLVQKEKNRGFHINVPIILNEKSKKLFDFYLNFPKMTPVCALNFIYNFPTVEALLRSSVNDLKKKGCISSHKATSLYNYFKNEFTFHNST